MRCFSYLWHTFSFERHSFATLRGYLLIMKLTHLLYTSAALAALPLAAFAQGNPSRPNLVFIMADQFRGDALGCLQQEPMQTPHLDQLASESILFTEAVSSYPVSSPARAMLMTGMYPMANGVTGNCNSLNTPYGVELSTEAVCWSDVLKQAGYATAYIGKWHLDAPHPPYVDTSNNRGAVAWNEWCPPERRHGFDRWMAYGTYDNHLHPMYWDTLAGRDEFHYVDQWGPAYEADRAIEFIRTESVQSDRPFALVVSMNPPHTGYELVPDAYKRLYDSLDVEALTRQKPYIPEKGTPEGDYFRANIRNYYACITGVDEQVGRIVQALKDCGLFENTLLVFTSDHGVCMGGHGVEGKNVFYEEAMRIPMICCWKGRLHPQRSDLPVAFADLYPTLLSLMGRKAEIPSTVQTHDWSRYFLQEQIQTPEDAFQPYYYCEPSDPTSGRRGIRTARYTYVVDVQKGKVTQTWLYDRTTDPGQLHNVAESQPARCDSLRQTLIQWLGKTHDPFVKYLTH